MKHSALGALAAAVVALTSYSAVAQEKVNLRFLTAWDDRFDGTQVVAKEYAKDVTEASNGRITFTFSGPEVVPPNQQFEPVSRGVFDLGFITPIYYLGTTGVPFAFFALPTDPKLWREKGYWDFADKEFERFNQKLLAFVTGSTQDDFYQIILREPLPDTDQPFAGKKIRGNKYYGPIVEPLGGSLVNLPAGEIYSSLEKGVVDGAAYPVAGMQRLKMQEVTKYMMRPRFGTSPFSVAMNLDRFKALSPDDQKLLLDQGRKLEQSVATDFDAMATQTVEDLKAAGMQETTLRPDLFEKVNAGLKKGVWQTALDGNKQTTARVQELYDMAKKNGDAE